jgi:hypothetical protein
LDEASINGKETSYNIFRPKFQAATVQWFFQQAITVQWFFQQATTVQWFFQQGITVPWYFENIQSNDPSL